MQTSLSAWTLQASAHSRSCCLQPAAAPQQRRPAHSPRERPAQRCRCRAAQTEIETEEKRLTPEAGGKEEGNWVAAFPPEDLPKGTRKEVTLAGEAVLLFWYRNEIYAIEARSPAEGAYSEGFIKAKLTQDYGIECPGTSSTFSLKTGEIMLWYPKNPVLRLITPQDTCRKLSVYPVRLTQDAIEVDVGSQVASGRSSKSMQQSQNDDVMVMSTQEYVQGEESGEIQDAAGRTANFVAATVALVGSAGAGTAVAIYKETTTGLYIFWAVYVVVVGALAVNYFKGNKEWL